MTKNRVLLAGAIVITLVGAAAVQAQPNGPANTSSHTQQQPNGPPNALQGFSQNRDKPIKINSATLEVRDKDKVATFAGDVHLVQGDTTMRSKTLVVFYDDDPAAKPAPKPPAQGAQAGPQQNQRSRRNRPDGLKIGASTCAPR